MRVIQQGNLYPEEDIWCDYCKAHFAFTKSDVYIEWDKECTDIRHYYVNCPCCKHKQEVSAWAREWFE